MHGPNAPQLHPKTGAFLDGHRRFSNPELNKISETVASTEKWRNGTTILQSDAQTPSIKYFLAIGIP